MIVGPISLAWANSFCFQCKYVTAAEFDDHWKSVAPVEGAAWVDKASMVWGQERVRCTEYFRGLCPWSPGHSGANVAALSFH